MGLITTPLRRRAARHFEGLELLRAGDANSFGVESKSALQVRGNGTLALTADELLFAQWVPNRLVRIPRADISALDTARAWLGKTVGRELLVVRWSDDAIGLWVPDVDAWLSALREGAPASP